MGVKRVRVSEPFLMKKAVMEVEDKRWNVECRRWKTECRR